MNTHDNGGNGSDCNQIQIRAKAEATVAVRVFCGLTMILCAWAITNMRRCSNRMNISTCTAVHHVLVTHFLLAGFSITGISFADEKYSETIHFVADQFYMWIIALTFQENMAYLLLGFISILPSITFEHVVIYIIASFAASSSPSLGMVLPHFGNNHQESCFHPLWLAASAEYNQLAMIIPIIITLVFILAVSVYHLVKKDTSSQQLLNTCNSCLECVRLKLGLKSLLLMQLLIIIFFVSSLPQLVYWILASISQSKKSNDLEWLVVTVHGISGSLAGIITLFIQAQLMSCQIVPCSTLPFNISARWADSGDYQRTQKPSVTGTMEMESFRYPESFSGKDAQFYLQAWVCQCQHCVQHRNVFDEFLVKRAADYSLGFCSVQSTSQKSRKSSGLDSYYRREKEKHSSIVIQETI